MEDGFEPRRFARDLRNDSTWTVSIPSSRRPHIGQLLIHDQSRAMMDFDDLFSLVNFLVTLN